jgi:23S rRNA (guanosine2251-2'-O)-methyltransferase
VKRLLFGPHAVGEAVKANAGSVAVVLVAEGPPSPQVGALLAVLERAGVSVERRPTTAIDALARGVRHQGIAAISAGEYPYLDLDTLLERAGPSPLLVALDEITDVHNFGAIVRSAVALGADGVITLRDRAAPVTPAVVRAAAGATEHARIARVTNLARTLEQLRERGFECVGLDGGAERSIGEMNLRTPTLLAIGSEGRGLRRLVRERCSALARIPMSGAIGSLNASVAAAIAMYEAARQRSGA